MAVVFPLSAFLRRIVQRLGANCPETGGESSGANCLWGELSDIHLNELPLM